MFQFADPFVFVGFMIYSNTATVLKQSSGTSKYWVIIKYTQQAACMPSTHFC